MVFRRTMPVMASKRTHKAPKAKEKPETPVPMVAPFDAEALTSILIQTTEKLQPMMVEFIKKLDLDLAAVPFDPLNVTKAYAAFFSKLYEDPNRLADLQVQYMKNWMSLWGESTKKFMGQQSKDLYPAEGDRRFKSQEWHESALFDFIRQSYLMTSKWMLETVHDTKGLDDATRHKVEFYTKQFADAMSPSNFILTNPDIIQATIDSKGENLLKGFQNMIDDLERGHGHLKIRTTDYNAFKVGKNIATTPGSVVYQNDLMQLIQYNPATPDVFKTPLLIVPPWINKFYILDLRPDNSFIKWLTEQGHTVFVVSWVNPDRRLSNKSFADYMHMGVLDSLKQVETITGEEKTNIIGYCIGGTLLATTLAWMAAQGMDSRVASATFLTTLVDFRDPGDIKVFVDDVQLDMLEQQMQERGFFDSRNLKDAFSLLRANDLIWTFVVNNYLLGKEPFPFDLLYWNDDSTNMPAEMHGFYLRNMYRMNRLIEPGGITLDNISINVRKITTPSYILSTKDDHIAPWHATYAATQLFSGDVHFTLSGSGHVAGVVNPPAAKKYGYWTADGHPPKPDEWFKSAQIHEGSWWDHWEKWIETYSGSRIPPRIVKNAIEPAPGSYVMKKAD